MVMPKREKDKMTMKQVCLYKDEVEVINHRFKHYGDFTGFVRFCLLKKTLVNEYLDSKKCVNS